MTRRALILILGLILASIVSGTHRLGATAVVQTGQTATLLPDGRWLLLGGETPSGPVANAAIWNPRTQTTLPLLESLHTARAWHTATVLSDGTVLVLGGSGADGQPLAVAERVDPGSGRVEIVPGPQPRPRAHHTATLLTDGRVLIAGGLGPDAAPVAVPDLWEPGEAPVPAANGLSAPRIGHSATLLSDGRVLLWGGTDLNGQALSDGELYDPAANVLTRLTSRPSEPVGVVASLEGSLPAQGAVGVPVDAVISLRFSKPVLVESARGDTVVLSGATGFAPATVFAAEGGRLVFVTPAAALAPGTRYTVSLNGLVDVEGFLVPITAIQFTTEGATASNSDTGSTGTGTDTAGATQSSTSAESSTAANGTGLDEWEWKGEKRNGKPYSRWQDLPTLQASPGVTALTGQVLRLNGQPLADVTLRVGAREARTDDTGRFLLTDIPAGSPLMVINGATVNQPGKTYGRFIQHVDIVAAKTNVLPYTIWLPLIDTQHVTHLPVPTPTEIVATTPLIPGLEMRVPAGVVLRDREGQPVREITLTRIPVDRPPFPLPPGADFFFTPEMLGARVERADGTPSPIGVQFVIPNYKGLAPGVRVDLWEYDIVYRWHAYGQGTVRRDGKQIMPDTDVQFHRVGCAFILGNDGNVPPLAPSPGQASRDGDPVDLSTGLFVLEKTDVVIPDVIPIVVQRTYRPGDVNYRPFGFGHTHSYQILLTGDTTTYQWANLILPTGTKVRYTRTSPGTTAAGAVMEHTTSGTRFYGSRLTRLATSWDLTFPDGTGWEFQDGNPGPLLSAIRDRHGNRLTITRQPGSDFLGIQSWNRVLRVTSPSGRWVEFSYDTAPNALITSMRDNAGRTWSYTYAGTDLTSVTDPAGGVTQYTWTPTSHQLLTIRDARGIVFLTNEYDAAGRVSRQTQADGSIYDFAYTLDVNGKLIQTDVTNPRGYVRRVTFDLSGYTTSDTRAAGTAIAQTTTYERDATTHRVTATMDPLSRRTEYTYDVAGNVLAVTRLAGAAGAVTTTYTYEPTFQQVTSVTDPLSHTTSFAYDAQGKLTTVTDPTARQTTFTYNPSGQPLTITTPAGTTTLGYDFGDLVTVTDPGGQITRRFPDALGRLAALTNPLGQQTAYEYDALNRVTRVTDALGGITQFAYDSNGNLLSLTDARSNATSYVYDNMDRVQTRTDPLLRAESYTYDLNGNPVTNTDRKSQVTSRVYDALDRLTSVTYADSSTTSYSWDAGNRMTQVTDSVAGTITRSYDLLDRLLQETTPEGTVSYTYDAAGRRSTMTAAGQPTVTYGYDNADRLVSITQSSALISLTYDAAGRRAILTLPNGLVTEYGYDSSSRLTALTYRNGTTTLGTLTYGYDADGQRRQVGGTWARTGIPQPVATATYNGGNHQLTFGGQTLTYDLNGNLTSDGTSTYTWNARNQLAAISGSSSATFGYDGLGRRRTRTVNGTTTTSLHDRSNPIQEQRGATLTNTLGGAGLDEWLVRSTNTGAETFLTDGLGSTVALTDSTGAAIASYTYEPFGATSITGVTTNQYDYTGREEDGTGLKFYRARYYSPSLQRFVSEDPIGFRAGDTNLFAYVRNDPVDYSDPEGLFLKSRTDIQNDAMAAADSMGFAAARNDLQHAAFRHCVGSCDLTNEWSGPLAWLGADAREVLQLTRRGQSWGDTMKGVTNNRRGRSIAAGWTGLLLSRAVEAAGGRGAESVGARCLEECKTQCTRMLDSGRLRLDN